MVFTKANRNQLRLAGALAVAVTALTVTACGGGGSTAALPQGAAPGHWTAAEVSQFTAAAGAAASDSQESCIIGYFERDMSFGNAMAVAAVDPASGPSMSPAQIKAALVSKYGTAEGDAIDAQFDQVVVTDSSGNCSGSAAAATAPAASTAAAAAASTAAAAATEPAATEPAATEPAATAPAATAPAATSESSCTVDCVNPVASGESGWLAQVQGALQNVQKDLSSISSDTSGDPDNLFLDGSELEGDAQAALDPNYDPPPADNTDWVTAMNDYVTAGEDYSGDNMNQQDDTPAQASQAIAAGNAALASFNAANDGVLNGIIQSLRPPA